MSLEPWGLLICWRSTLTLRTAYMLQRYPRLVLGEYERLIGIRSLMTTTMLKWYPWLVRCEIINERLTGVRSPSRMCRRLGRSCCRSCSSRWARRWASKSCARFDGFVNFSNFPKNKIINIHFLSLHKKYQIIQIQVTISERNCFQKSLEFQIWLKVVVFYCQRDKIPFN